MDEKKLKFYRYKVESLNILFPGETEPTTVDANFVTSISIEHDYDNDYFPIINLSVNLKPKVYFKILKNKLDVKFRLRVQKFISNKDDNNFNFVTDIINDIFSVFIDENTPFIDEKLYDTTKATEGTETNLQDVNQNYTFFIFKEKDLSQTKNLINNVISEASMTDVITYIISTSGFNKVLMTKLENKNSYKQIIIPPMTLLGSLNYLEEQYGFYSTGALIFFDYDCAYIIDSSPKCSTYRIGEYKQTIFTINSSTNANRFTPGCYINDDERKFYINITPDSININNLSVVGDQIDGNNMLIINPNSGVATKNESKTIQRGTGTYKILVNRFGNEFSNNVAKIRKSETSNIVNIVISNFDVNALTPNKEFLFIFEESSLNQIHGGTYRLCSNKIEFVKKGNEFFVYAACELKKFML